MNPTIDELYEKQISLLADDDKLRLVELIAHELALRNGDSTPRIPQSAEDRQAARDQFRRHAGAVSLGLTTGADNERIDADLAREYGAGGEPS